MTIGPVQITWSGPSCRVASVRLPARDGYLFVGADVTARSVYLNRQRQTQPDKGCFWYWPKRRPR